MRGNRRSCSIPLTCKKNLFVQKIGLFIKITLTTADGACLLSKHLAIETKPSSPI